MNSCDIAIVGAGPYGLSAAAHLRQASGGLDVRVFGECMSFWERHMPVGMLLRSPWAGSHLSDPQRHLTLDAYRSKNGNHVAVPLLLEHFINYGRWFQRQAVPSVDSRRVARIDEQPAGFHLKLEDGDFFTSRRVVVASGILPFAWRPLEFGNLSPEIVSHSSDHRDLTRFAGRRTIIVGSGQSALESAALLHEAGSKVEVIARRPAIRWAHGKPLLHTWPISALLYAPADVGPAIVSHLIARPNFFRQLPRGLQERCGPSTRSNCANWLKPRLADVSVTTGRTIKNAIPSRGEVKLILDDGTERHVNHVLLCTGYRVNIALYPFLSEKLLKSIHCVGGYPQLNAGFECSAPGLYFLGAPAAWSFGPLMGFIAGAEFASRALTRAMVGTRKRPVSTSGVQKVGRNSELSRSLNAN